MDRGRLGPFALEERLGDAKSSNVYRAIHLQQRRQMAVRIVSQARADSNATVEEFAKEAEFLKTLDHPGVVRCFGAGVFEKESYLVSELVRGESFDAVLARRGRLPWDTVVDYAVQICNALEYAHQRGTLHLRLNSAKLLLTEDGTIKIAGFLGNRLNEVPRDVVADRPLDQLACTPPELIVGKPAPSQQSDLYSLGCVLFQMLTGRLPFPAATHVEMINCHIKEVAPRVTTLEMDCPVWLESLVAQLLEKHPSRRPHFASAVAVALRETREKVEARTGLAQHAVSGRASALQIPQKNTDVKRLLRRKSARKETASPIYERPWFLAICVALLLLPVGWAFWPASEGELFAKAEQLMASDDRSQWQDAKRWYLDPLVKRFPNGEHFAQVQDYLDRIEIDKAETRLQMNLRFGREGKSEGERRFVEAKRFEDFGDRLTALERYRNLAEQLKDSEADRPFVKLAEREILRLEKLKLTAEDRFAAVEAQLEEADALYKSDDALGARKIWNRVVAAYVDKPELAPLVERARARLGGKRSLEKAEEPGEERTGSKGQGSPASGP